jgi:hypothetical protein
MKLKKMNYCPFVLVGVLLVMLGITSLSHAQIQKDNPSAEEVRQEAQDFLQTLKAYTAEQRDEAVQKTKTVLDNLDKEIEALQTRIDNNWETMDKAAREKARARLQELHKLRTQAAEWYGSLKTSSVDAWEHMKKGFSNAYQALHNAWEKSKKEFETDK